MAIVLGHFSRIRSLMLNAHALGMTSGEYVFIYFKTATSFLSDEWYDAEDEDGNEASKECITATF